MASRVTVNLASQTGKKVQMSDDILRQIEASLPDASQQSLTQQQGGLSARLQGRINEHALTYGDKSLPRQRLPKVDNVLLDRYQAARHNVLVLGAIQQAEAKSKQNTQRSHKGGSHTPARGSSRPGTSSGKAALRGLGALSSTSALDSEAAGDDLWGDGGAGAGAGAGGSLLSGGLDSEAFSSFKSRASSKGLGSIPEDDGLSTQPSGVLNPEASQASGRKERRGYNRQGSSSSIVSRISAASYASGLTGVSGVSSSGQRRHLRQQQSYISSGGSSGHTLRSHRAGSVAGSSYGGQHKKGARRKPPKPEPGRISRALTEFGSKDDWVSKTLLKHTLAAIIQAHWRGFWVRQRWKVNREQLVLDEQARLQADSLHHARLQELQHKLALYEQKKLAAAAAEAAAAAAVEDAGAAPDGVSPQGAAAAGAVGGTAVSRATSAVWRRGEGQLAAMPSWQSLRGMGESSYQQGDAYAAACGSDSDSGWSDVELEDVAAIKFRAVTPPWQRGPDKANMSRALQQRTAAAAAAALGEPFEAADWAEGLRGMGCCWDADGDDTTAKLQEVRHRRICRKPEAVPLSPSAVAAAAVSGLLAAPGSADDAEGPAASSADAATGAAGDAEDGAQLAAAAALPQHVVEALLLERYSGKYARLGVPDKMPGRQRWLKMQAEAAEAAAEEAVEAAVAEDAVQAAGVAQGVDSAGMAGGVAGGGGVDGVAPVAAAAVAAA